MIDTPDVQGYIERELYNKLINIEDYYVIISEIEEQIKEMKNNIRQTIIERYEEDPNSIQKLKVSSSNRTSVKWKAIAEELNPPEDLVERYTTRGDTVYRISIPRQEEYGDA